MIAEGMLFIIPAQHLQCKLHLIRKGRQVRKERMEVNSKGKKFSRKEKNGG